MKGVEGGANVGNTNHKETPLRATLSTPTWGVSVQPHGAYGNSNPSGVNLQEALGWHGAVIEHEWISVRHRCGQEASRFSTTALRRFPTGQGR